MPPRAVQGGLRPAGPHLRGQGPSVGPSDPLAPVGAFRSPLGLQLPPADLFAAKLEALGLLPPFRPEEVAPAAPGRPPAAQGPWASRGNRPPPAVAGGGEGASSLGLGPEALGREVAGRGEGASPHQRQTVAWEGFPAPPAPLGCPPGAASASLGAEGLQRTERA